MMLNISVICSKCYRGLNVKLEPAGLMVDPCDCTRKVIKLRDLREVIETLESLRHNYEGVKVTFTKVDGTLRTITGALICWTRDRGGQWQNLLIAEGHDPRGDNYDYEPGTLRTFRLKSIDTIETLDGTVYEVSL